MALRITDVLDRTAAAHADRPALRVRIDGAWRTTTWREYRDQIRRAARGLMTLGLGPGDHVTIIGANRPQWFVADVATIAAGGVPAGIYTTNSAEQCHFIAAHCAARVAIVEDVAQLAKFLAVRDRLPALRWIVLMDGASAAPGVVTWERLLARGDEVFEAELDARIAAQRADDVCTLIYTSGTTGEPKAVMLTHDNITWTAERGAEAIGSAPTDDVVSYLPLSHIAEQITTLFGSLVSGSCVWFAESLDTLGDTLRAARPHYFLGVPRVWEKIQERMQAAGAQSPAVRRRIVRWARGVGLAGGYATQRGGPPPTLYPVADRLVFSKVRAQLGLDRARMLITSAAPISRDTLEFFLSLGLPICEVYGMSECTGPATMSWPDRYRTGAAGVCLPGAELKIAADGEVCMRGRHVFRGYYRDPEGTAAALDAEGWLHSGDIGELDADGFLRITDRKKELIITAGGENVAPQLVEGHLKAIPVVSQAVVVGDRRRYVAALLALDPVKVPRYAELAGSPARDPVAAAGCDRFLSCLQRDVDAVNQRLARVQTVKRFAVIPNELTIEGGELTPTMKLKRRVIGEKYRDVIEQLYA